MHLRSIFLLRCALAATLVLGTACTLSQPNHSGNAHATQHAAADKVSYWDGSGKSGQPSIEIHLGEQRAYFCKGKALVGVSELSTGREGHNIPEGSLKVIDMGEGGSIINIGSVVSRITPPNSVVYTGTKGAVDAITGVLAKELGARKIRVNSINPGLVETEGTKTAGTSGPDSEMEKWVVAQTPLGRVGQPGDIASVAVFLASDDSGWLTGEHLLAGGGLR